MPLLIITLPLQPADPAALLDYVYSPDGLAPGQHGSAPVAMLPAPQRQTEVVAVVPLQRLSWLRVQLPQGSLSRKRRAQAGSPRLRSILDGLLEDQLLDDTAQLHLALQPQPRDGAPLWVAACDRAWLQAALALLAQAGHPAARIVPESTPQALAQAIEVTGDTDHPQVAFWLDRAGGATGVNVPGATGGRPAGPALSELTGADPADGVGGVLVCPLSPASAALLPTDTPVLAEPGVAAAAERLLGRAPELQQRSQRLLRAAQTPWDLAQFEFTNAQRDPRRAQWAAVWQGFWRLPQWRAARWALVLLLLGNLIGLNAWALREQARLAQQRQQVRAVLTQTFPNIPVVVDAPLQMAREVAQLQRSSGASSGTDLEALLAAFAALAPPGYAAQALDFEAQSLRLNGPALSAPEQARILEALQAQGLSVSVQAGEWRLAGAGLP